MVYNYKCAPIGRLAIVVKKTARFFSWCNAGYAQWTKSLQTIELELDARPAVTTLVIQCVKEERGSVIECVCPPCRIESLDHLFRKIVEVIREECYTGVVVVGGQADECLVVSAESPNSRSRKTMGYRNEKAEKAEASSQISRRP